MRRYIVSLVLLIASTSPAVAEANDWDRCLDAQSTTERLEVCGRVARSDAFPARVRAGAHNNSGVAYSALQQPERALEEYNAAIELQPDFAIAIYNRARVYRVLGDLERSMQGLDAALLLAPSDPDILNESCWIRVILDRDMDAAERFCDAAVSAAPHDADALDTRALLRFKQGDFVGALEDYDAAIGAAAESHPDHFRYGRGVTLLRLGREAEGRVEIEAALAINPEIGREYAAWGVTP